MLNVDLEFHERLKCQLRLAGSSMANISRSLGISQSSVTVVSQGYRRSRRIEAEIARQLGTSAEKLFADCYNSLTTQNEEEQS